MDEKLKALLSQAEANGADETEMKKIIRDYLLGNQKKKEEASPYPSVLGVGSLGSSSPTDLGGEQSDALSDWLTAPRIGDKVVPEYQADIISTYAEDFDNAYLQGISERFDVDRYRKVAQSKQEFLAPFDQGDNAVRNTLIRDSLVKYDASATEDQKDAAKKEIIDLLYQSGDPDFEVNRFLLAGTDENLANNMLGRDEVEGDYAMTQKYTQSERANEAMKKIGGLAAMTSGPKFREMVPEEIRNNPEQLSNLERELMDEFGVVVDLNSDTYVGGYEFLKDNSAGLGTTIGKAWRENLAGAKYMLGDMWASMAGDDNMLSNYLIESADESKRLAEEAAKRLPFSLQSYWDRTGDLMEKIGTELSEGEVGLADQAISQWVDESLRLGGESMPMMGGALAAGWLTRGRSMRGMGYAKAVKGLRGAERVAAQRKFIEANRNLRALSKGKTTVSAQMARRAQSSAHVGALGATTFMGMASTYNQVRDEEWFQEMDGLEKAGYTSVMGFLEGAPAFVGAAIATNVLRSAGKKGIESFVKGLMKNVGLAMVEEGVTEGVTAAGQYYINSKVNPNVEFSMEGLWDATKEGWLAGVVLGGGIAGTTGALSVGVKATSLAATAVNSVRDRVVITQLAEDYDNAPTKELRKEIGKKLNDAIARAWDRKLGRAKFYEGLAETNPEAFQKIEEIQKRIAKLGVEHSRAQDEDTRAKLKAEMTALLDERGRLDSEFGLEYDIDIESETNRVLRGIARIDKRYSGYGELFQGDADSVTVTAENSDAVLDAINGTTFESIDQFDDGSFKSGSQMQKALRNVVTAVKALTKTGKVTKVTIHKTLDSFRAATGRDARGAYLGKGEIHVYAPAILQNTGFHEAFHDVVLEALGQEAVTGMAEQFFASLTGPLRSKYTNFLRQYGNAGDIRKAIRENPEVAEEFLIELLADMSAGNVDVAVKKGLLNSFKSFLIKAYNTIPGTRDIDLSNADPKVQDLVDAMKKLTGQMAEGEELTSVEEVRVAAVKAGYNAMMVELEDLTAPKLQGMEARMRDVEEVADASRYATAMAEATDRMSELKMKMFLQVDPITVEDAQQILDDGGRLFMTKDGLAGAYVKANGYMGGLFKNPDSQLKAVSKPLQTARQKAGGRFYDAFATKLENIYVGNGWKPVARLDFNEEFAPDGWNDPDSPLIDKPDVVFFVKGEGEVGAGIRLNEYMEAFDYAERMANGKAQAMLKSLEDKPGRDSYLDAEGVTEGELEQRREELKLDESQRRKRSPKVVTALKDYVAQDITQDQYIEVVREETPITPFVSVPGVPTTLDIGAALTSNKLESGIIGLNKKIPDNYYVGLRLDIPAYDNYDVWVVSIHQGARGEERTPNLGGKSIGYGQTALATNVEFHSVPKGALNIALEKGKTTIARMFGDWSNHDPQQLRDRAEEIMNSDEYNMSDLSIGKLEGWVQVGMNPFRHSWFYDKRDGNPIASASEVIQIGALVLAKDVEKVSPADERYNVVNKDGTTVKFQQILPGQTVKSTEAMTTNKAQNFGRFSNKYAKDDSEFKKLMRRAVVHNQDAFELLEGRTIMTSSPDNLMVGAVYFDGEKIFEGGGGVFYPVNSGNVWAFADTKEAKVVAEKINAMRKASPDGKVFFTLVSGTQEKLFSNTGALRASEQILRLLMEQGVLPESVFNKLIIDTFKKTFPKERPIRIDGSRAEVVSRILEYMGSVKGSNFGKRKYFTDRMFVNMGVALKENQEARDAIQEMLDTDKVGKSQGGSVVKAIVARMLTEEFLQAVPPGMIYGAIEIDSDVTFVEDAEASAIFPAAVIQVDENGNKKQPKLHLFKDKVPAKDVLVTERGFRREAFVETFSRKYEGRKRKDGTFKDPAKAADTAWHALLGLRNQPYGMARYKGKAQNMVQEEGKAQGNLIRLVSQMLDSKYPSPIVKRDKRRKNPVTGIDESMQMDAFVRVKKEVIDTLIDYGMTKEAAERMYKEAVAYRQGRTKGRREGMRVAMRHAAETRKMSTKAKNLKKSLEELRDKSETFNEFLAKAIELIDARMKENAKTPFTRGQVKALVKYIRQAHKTSGKRVKEEGLDAMQSFINKISIIFDQRDTKAEMQRYLDGIKYAKTLQARLKRMANVRGRGAAPKSVATYAKIAKALAAINPSLLPQAELENFVKTLMQTISSMSKTKAEFDKEIEAYVGVSSPKTNAETLRAVLSTYSAMEELGRQSLFMARAQVRAAKNNTSVQEEYDKLVKNYERSRLSYSRRAILNFIDENPTVTHPDTGELIALDENNPAHIDIVTQILAEQASTKEELQKDAIIYDVLVPRIVANIEKLLEDSQIADILGIYSVEDLDVDQLVKRLQMLKRHHIINLDYRLDDYIINDAVYGIGYMHSLVKGVIDMPNYISRLRKSKGLKGRSGILFSPLDTVNSYLSHLVITDRLTMAKLRVAIGLAQITNSFARADFMHAQIVELVEAEINRIAEEGGSVTTKLDNAIAQIYSMARQLPDFEGERAGAEAAWYIEIRNAMRRTIDYYEQQKTFSKEEINEFEDAYNYLFGDATTLPELISKVESDRKDIAGYVQFVSDIHSTLMPQFRNYVERYLGKELETEDNYTAFEVIPETGVRDVDDILRMRKSLQEQLAGTSLSGSKKVAGSSFERNPRSLKGKNRIGLDFFAINERTLRDNIILSQTVGDVVAANHAMNSDAMKELITDTAARKELERKIMLYVQQDTGKVPVVFQPTGRIRGVRFVNPIYVLRQAAIIKAFGGVFFQTLKQSTVLTSVMFQTSNPLQAIPYLIGIVYEMAAYTLGTAAREDSKLALDDGRYKLLQNSPVFQRDYEAGNIDPYTGSISFDEPTILKISKKFSDFSLKNLKGTDKVAAVASWFVFYGDALISEGVVDSFDEIDWDAEAASPNETALSYADMMVSKDQAASTPREAADLYQQEKGFKSTIAYLAQNILLPFSRFAVNKKRSISVDSARMTLGDALTRKESSIAMVGHATELALFQYVNKIVLGGITYALYSALFGDEEEEKMPEENTWRDISTQVVVDAQPLPPYGPLDNKIKAMMNRYLWYPMDVMREGDYDLGDDDGYERWKRIGKGATMYYKGRTRDETQALFRGLGPYGDFLDDARTTIENINLPNNKVVSSTGMEYYVRPEDKDALTLHYFFKLGLMGGQLVGLSSKELDYLVKKMDDLGRDRRLSSEEALAAYESIAEQYGESLMEGEGEDRIMRIIDEGQNPFDKRRSAEDYRRSIKPLVAEGHVKTEYPEQAKLYMREARTLPKSLKNARDYYAYLRSKRESMEPKEFKEFKDFIDTYLGMVRPSFYIEEQYIESAEE